jgi:uncharacterized membrane protein YeaQ/YmgE (transglycosylase-associated protein family)
MGIISWIVFGLVVGALARLVMPGQQAMGIIMTILLGIAGSFVGGFLSSLITGGSPVEFRASSLIWSFVGAIALLFLYGMLQKKRA